MILSDGTPQEQMSQVVQLMREMSREADPQQMVRVYRERVGTLMKTDASLALSRRGLTSPQFRITRSTRWKDEVNPWLQRDRLPLLSGGILAEVLYAGVPRIIDDLKITPADSAFEYLKDFRSLFANPLYENGEAINMNIVLMKEPNAIDPAKAPMLVWLGNLFGRATGSLVLADKLRIANESLDRELKAVAEIQRSLLPPVLPDIQGLRLAAHYETSQRAGGDYYDLFTLPDGRLGMLIADVSGHGTPAAVMMAITHTVAHSFPDAPTSPGALLRHLNDRLFSAYRRGNTGFVTAFYAVYDPAASTLRYSSAGHNPPRLRRNAGVIEGLDGGRDIPLGVLGDVRYTEAQVSLDGGDGLLLYTDGITEARSTRGEEFTVQRLDQTLTTAPPDPGWTIAKVLESVAGFTSQAPPEDDRTLVAAEVIK